MAFILVTHRDVCNLFVFLLCFQSGGRGATHLQEKKGLVETDCPKIHGVGHVAVVSKPLSIFLLR